MSIEKLLHLRTHYTARLCFVFFAIYFLFIFNVFTVSVVVKTHELN